MKRLQPFLETLFLFIASLTPILWLSNGEIILGHDSGFRLDPLGYLKTLFFSWNPLSGFGADVSSNTGFLMAQLPEALLVKLTSSLSTGQTLSFIFWFFIIGYSMYMLIKNFFPQSRYWPLRIISSSFYMYNFYLLQGWFITERAKFSLFAALPLVFLFSWNTLARRYSILKGSVLFSLTLFFLNGGGSPPLYGGIIVVLAIVFSYFVVLSLCHKSLPDFFYCVKSFIAIGVATIALNAYWVFPLLYAAFTQYSSQLSNSGGLAGILAWEDAVNKYASVTNLLRFQGIPDWYGNTLHPYSGYFFNSPVLIAVSFIPIVSILFVLMKKGLRETLSQEKKFLFVSLLVFLIGLVMTAGSHPPFGFIYVALLRYVPGFAIFRSAFYKFGPSFWFGGSVLLGASLFTLVSWYIKPRALRITSFLLLTAGILMYHFPYFSGNFFNWNYPFTTKVRLPSYVEQMFSYMHSRDKGDGARVMLLPPLDTRFLADSYTWGFWSLDLLPRLATSVPVLANDSRFSIVAGLYDAAVENNSDIFYPLAKKIGIGKILWRNDVLYSDKKTGSSDFSYIRSGILENTKAVKEKNEGEWTLYDIGGKEDSSVTVEPLLYRADIHPSDLSLFYRTAGVVQYPLVLGSSLVNATIEKNIGRFLEGNIIRADCMFCDALDQNEIEQLSTIPYVRFLPDSFFYPYIVQKEAKVLRGVKNVPEQRIDADLGLATKRLVEISGIIGRDSKENAEPMSKKISQEFRRLVDDAMGILENLGEVKKNTYKIKIHSYIKFYARYLSDIDQKNVLSRDFITSLYDYLRSSMDAMSRDVWISSSTENGKYYLSIPTAGIYKLAISENKGKALFLRLDGKAIGDQTAVFLTEGVHKIELDFPIKNELSGFGNISEKISLTYSKKKSYPLPNLKYQDPYVLQFNYRISEGRSIYVSFHQNNDTVDTSKSLKRALVSGLTDDGKWHIARFTITPNFGATSGEILFFTANTSDDTNELEISDLSMKNARPASIYALRENMREPDIIPLIQTTMRNPSMYEVKVSNAVSPFILNFKQSYNNGWKAFVLSDGSTENFTAGINPVRLFMEKPIETESHLSLDGYTNAWYVSRTGNFSVLLVYWPHVIFLTSGILTVISLFIALLLMLGGFLRKG